ncbi:hypothetical protein QE375_001621 [Microbacterium foliorum]|uniref:Uncharacterized protein n=1 Tax=Microbacterium foliorum TaxID=104336 RepID=A0ABU1HPU4_9MICO|nr:hypothetical protein [Microbacterium foliorum]MDR6142067.1 hypothetical protein [Microbacterium foliorum]
MADDNDKPEWTADRDVTRAELRIVDMIHEGKPQCRECGQITNRPDKFGLCSKTSDAHQQRRGITPKRKAGKR